jgi:hypothetical protein
MLINQLKENVIIHQDNTMQQLLETTNGERKGREKRKKQTHREVQ